MNDTVVFTTGVFDLIHINHLSFLRRAKQYGSYFIVGLCSDKLVESYKRKPIFNYEQRYTMLKELDFIDEIVRLEVDTQHRSIQFYQDKKIDYQIQVDCDKHLYTRTDVNFIFIKPSFGLHTSNIINKLKGNIRNVCLVGGTATTHYLSSILGEKSNYNVNVLTRNPTLWNNNTKIYDNDNNIICHGNIDTISDKPNEVIPNSDIIIISVPSFALNDIILQIKPYIRDGMIIGKFPGTGGFDWLCKKHLDCKNITIFGTQRLPFIVRTLDYGLSCKVYGHKKKNIFSCIPFSQSNLIQHILQDILTYECIPLKNYLNITLVPSNPILHPSRLYSMFRNWNISIQYDKPIKFYEEWDHDSYINLKGCDNEVQEICKNLPTNVNILPIKDAFIYNYEDDIVDKTNLLTIIKTNKSFQGIEVPMIKHNDKYIPNYKSRYLTEDIPYGLVIIKSIALMLDISTPYIDKILLWGQTVINKEYLVDNKLIGKDVHELNIPQNLNISKENLLQID